MCVLHMVRFVLKLFLEDRAGPSGFDSSSLNKHAGHDSVNFRAQVADVLAIRLTLEAFAESEEVITGFGRQVMEQLKNDLSRDALGANAEVGKLTLFVIVDSFAECSIRCGQVFRLCFLHIKGVVIQSPFRKLVAPADVLFVVEVN